MNIRNEAKRILCYGDSLTWGYVPNTDHKRFPPSVRWTGVLQSILGDNFEVIEEGLNSRTLNSEDVRPGKEGRNGSTYLIPCLDTHDPIDFVILMLGSNELKDSFGTSAKNIMPILEDQYVRVILNREPQTKKTPPKLILVCPPAIDVSKRYAKERYSTKSSIMYIALREAYKTLSAKYKLPLVESKYLATTGEDGVHLNKDGHKQLAIKLSEVVRSISS